MMKISIVGLGVIGGSFAEALKTAGYENVYGIDNDQETLDTAVEMGIIKAGYLDGKDILPETDLTIMALYPKTAVRFTEANHEYFKTGAILMDTTGIKEKFIADMADVVPDNIEVVYTHPMAGRENRGIAYAQGSVFQGANFLLIPTDVNNEDSLVFIEDLANKLGFGKINRVSAAFHDQMISFTSQLPHAIAISLMNSDHEKRETGKFTGDSYPELTRIAKINEDLWSELFIDNKKYLLQSIKDFENQLDMVKTAIREEDSDTLKNLFIKSTTNRLNLEEQMDKRKMKRK
jgi:prephenate dehydrogenase